MSESEVWKNVVGYDTELLNDIYTEIGEASQAGGTYLRFKFDEDVTSEKMLKAIEKLSHEDGFRIKEITIDWS